MHSQKNIKLSKNKSTWIFINGELVEIATVEDN